MNYITRGLLLVFSLMFLGVAGASADPCPRDLVFDLTGPVTASFQLPAGQLSIDPSDADLGFGFIINPSNLMINGAPSSDFLAFYNGAFGGAFWAFSSGFAFDVALSGPQLYPRPGEHSNVLRRNIFLVCGLDDAKYTLTISSVSTPEPSGLLLLAAGLSAMLFVGLMSKQFRSAAAIAAR